MRATIRSFAAAILAVGLAFGMARPAQAAPASSNQAAGSPSPAVSHAGPDIYYTGPRRNPSTVQLRYPDGTLLSINTRHRREFRHAYMLSKRVGHYRARMYYKLRVRRANGSRVVELRIWYRNLLGEAAWHAVSRRLNRPPSATVYHR